MASNEDVENETTDENILYDLTIHAEWKQENELFVRVLILNGICFQNNGIFLTRAN